MPDPAPELSKAEWLIMNACWDRKNLTARDVHEAVAPQREWEYQTVKTMLDRLVEKGYLRREVSSLPDAGIVLLSLTDKAREALAGFSRGRPNPQLHTFALPLRSCLSKQLMKMRFPRRPRNSKQRG